MPRTSAASSTCTDRPSGMTIWVRASCHCRQDIHSCGASFGFKLTGVLRTLQCPDQLQVQLALAMPPRADRKRRCWEPSVRTRVEQGQGSLDASVSSIGWLKDYTVKHTTGDGFCFFRVVCAQLGMDDPEAHLYLAACVLSYVADHAVDFDPFVTVDDMDARKSHLNARGLDLTHILDKCEEARSMLLLYILDQWAGLQDKDWSLSRRYADHLLVEAFARWSGVPVLILKVSTPGEVTWLGGAEAEPDNCVKLVHYDEGAYEHFNEVVPIVGVTPQSAVFTKVTHSMVSVYIKLSDPLSVPLQMVVEMLVGPISESSDEESGTSATSDSAPHDAGHGSSTPPAGSSSAALPDADQQDQSDVPPADTGGDEALGSRTPLAGSSSAALPDAGQQDQPDVPAADTGGDEPAAGASLPQRPDDSGGIRSVAPRHMLLESSPHPRAAHECRIAQFAQHLRHTYRVPLHPSGREYEQSELMSGVFLPQKHCVWQGCTWTGTNDTDVIAHVLEQHNTPLLQECMAYYHPVLSQEHRAYTVINLALKGIANKQAPSACVSIDRRGLFGLHSEMSDPESIQSLVCFCCACSHVYMKHSRCSRIKYHEAQSGCRGPQMTKFLGLSRERVRRFFGLEEYLQRSEGASDTGVSLRSEPFHSEFRDWSAEVSFAAGTVTVLCCPEDVTCDEDHSEPGTICSRCRIPVCHRCNAAIGGPQPTQPMASLANDLWVGFACELIYKENVTYMELVCASPCISSLICFVLEGQRGGGVFHEQAHMQRHRTAARGNVTLFPLPLEDVVRSLQDLNDGQIMALPRLGEDLEPFVKVLLKSSGDLPSSIITQSTVRRRVVVALIEECCSRGHPAYRSIDMAAVRQRALKLPQEGPLPGVVKELANDNSVEKICPQKAATPQPVAPSPELAFVDVRPNAVAMEKSGSLTEDSVESAAHAWVTVEETLQGHAQLSISTGSKMLDLFRPDFLCMAFPFLFKTLLAFPDSRNAGTRRDGARKLLMPQYAAIMCRRIENQFRADWSFPYALWNATFRQLVNSSRILYSVAGPPDSEGKELTGQELERASVEICKALRGSYIAMDGKSRPVGGDVTKAYYAPGLSQPARRMLLNVSHMTRAIPGTQEVRRTMRFIAHSFRVYHGAAIFITLSPDEKHNSIMMRVARLRDNDPSVKHHPTSRKWFGRMEPPLVGWAEHDDEETPSFELRRHIMARSPLSAVDGFRTHLHLLFRHVFGMRVCPACPDCRGSGPDDWCRDGEGSSSTLEGGVLGRVAALVGSIEFQKAGAAHIHFHAFLECLHQHLSLEDIAKIVDTANCKLVDEYLQFKDYSCRQRYPDVENISKKQWKGMEESWPEHANTNMLCSLPSYLGASPAPSDTLLEEGKSWLQQYNMDLQEVMLRRQHHIHIPDHNGHKRPLGACKRKDKPNECKHGFPLHHQLTDRPLVMCQGIANRMRLPVSGKRSAIGMLHGALNHEYLNGCIPALSVGARDNNDIKVPYRFPVTASTHSSLCKSDCIATARLGDMVKAIGASQNATIGYTFDYATKRQPIGVYECREWMKDHKSLAQRLKTEDVRYAALRHTQRIVSDCYAKGLVRGAGEVVNLADHADKAKVTSAELVATSNYATFAGGAFLHAVEHGHNPAGSKLAKGLVHVSGAPTEEPVQIKKLGICYGVRGNDPELKYLSPYEFVRHWEVIRCPASLDVEIPYCRMFPKSNLIGDISSHWIMRRRREPIIPVFQGCPMPKQRDRFQERNAMIMMSYFHPWTLCQEFQSQHVPHVSMLGMPKDCERVQFTRACAEWMDGGILSSEMRNVVQGFMAVTQVRPRDPDAEGDNSDNQMSDEECFVSKEELAEALVTKIGGRAGKNGKDGDSHHSNAQTGISMVQQLWSSSNVAAKRKHKAVALPLSTLNTKEVVDSVRKLRAGDIAARDGSSARVKHAEARISKLPSKHAASLWISTKAKDLSDEQRGLLQRIADRCFQEDDDDAAGRASSSVPLRWLMHGKPGTGKSHVLRCVISFFEECLHWKKGVQFCVAALQAVTAAAVGGDTLHHTAAISPWNQNVDYSTSDA